MNHTLCPKCGKEIEKLYDNVCKDCFFENIVLAKLPLVLHVKTCAKCGARFDRSKWVNMGSVDDIVIQSVEDALSIHDLAENIEICIKPRQLTPYMYRVHAEVDAFIKDEPVHQELNTEVRIVREACDMCSRISGGYFEGIIQIRATNRVPTSDEKKRCIDIANEVVRRMQKKGDRLAFITDSIDIKDGADLYIGSNNSGRHICRAIIEQMGGSFSESPSLFGQKDGKDVYRITFSMRLPEFMSGDIIHFKDKAIQIKNIGKRTVGIDLSTGSRFMATTDEMKGATRIASMEDAVMTVLVAVEDDAVMVLDPTTYKTVTIKKPVSFMAQSGSEIPVIKTEYGLFALSGEHA
ncbi:MAG: NMD3-related protein [Methanosarcinaceae archaeon]|nr:NMD3-related protein [Methanosarcinaceae archaeon]